MRVSLMGGSFHGSSRSATEKASVALHAHGGPTRQRNARGVRRSTRSPLTSRLSADPDSHRGGHPGGRSLRLHSGHAPGRLTLTVPVRADEGESPDLTGGMESPTGPGPALVDPRVATTRRRPVPPSSIRREHDRFFAVGGGVGCRCPARPSSPSRRTRPTGNVVEGAIQVVQRPESAPRLTCIAASTCSSGCLSECSAFHAVRRRNPDTPSLPNMRNAAAGTWNGHAPGAVRPCAASPRRGKVMLSTRCE